VIERANILLKKEAINKNKIKFQLNALGTKTKLLEASCQDLKTKNINFAQLLKSKDTPPSIAVNIRAAIDLVSKKKNEIDIQLVNLKKDTNLFLMQLKCSDNKSEKISEKVAIANLRELERIEDTKQEELVSMVSFSNLVPQSNTQISAQANTVNVSSVLSQEKIAPAKTEKTFSIEGEMIINGREQVRVSVASNIATACDIEIKTSNRDSQIKLNQNKSSLVDCVENENLKVDNLKIQGIK
jgi:hypothetical protein